MMTPKLSGTLALALLVLAAPSTAQITSGSCNGNKRDDCPSNADVCFNNAGQTATIDGSGTWTVDISQCFKSSAVSFITWSPVDENGGCTECNGRKVEEVAPGTMLFSDVLTTYSADSCTGTPFCVYVHDGSLQKGKDGTPLGDVPSTCFSSTNQLCAMCSYIVTPTREQGSCDNGVFCDGPDVCGTGGACAPADPDADPCANAPLPSGVDAQCNMVECDEINDICGAVPTSGVMCDNGVFCDGPNDVCSSAGVCEAADSPVNPCASTPLPIGSDPQCSEIQCMEMTDSCDPVNININGPCSDGAFCTGPEICVGSSCITDDNAPPVCDSFTKVADEGCSVVVCTGDPDECVEDISEGEMCDDGDPCTINDACTAAGMCMGEDLCPGSCQTCDTTGLMPGCIPLPEGTSCDNPAAIDDAECRCDDSGECSICFTECAGGCAIPTPTACVVLESTPSRGTNCGNNCATLCEFVCGGPVADPACNSAGGCTCGGALSPFIGTGIIDTGPCCTCTSCPGPP